MIKKCIVNTSLKKKLASLSLPNRKVAPNQTSQSITAKITIQVPMHPDKTSVGQEPHPSCSLPATTPCPHQPQAT